MNFNMKESFKRIKNGGFSLIELVIVIAVLAILSILSGPYFLRLINLARFESAKNHMRDSFTSCINNPNISLSNPYIPGVAFQSSNCSSLITATIDNSCTISMDMSNGEKTGWDNSYDECTSATNTGSNKNLTQSSNSGSINSNDSNSSKLISSPVAIKNDCNNGIETGLFINDNGDLQESWDHDCKFTDVNSVKESGTINLDSGSITLLDNGEIKLEGSYLSGINLNETQQEEINKGGFKQIFAGGYGSYAAMRDDGSMLILGMNSEDDTETMNKLLDPPSDIKNIQFSYAGGAVKLDNGEILTWGNGGAYEEELKYRLSQ